MSTWETAGDNILQNICQNISASTRLLCLIGDPVKGSLSPLIHNIWAKEHGLEFVYLAFNVKDAELPDAIKGLSAIGAVGANVTAPHKESVLPYLQHLSSEAELIGAVNTIKFDALSGYNTDVEGFFLSLKEKGLCVKGEQVMLLGAGGASKAVALALSRMDVRKIHVVNRTFEKAERVCRLIKEKFGKDAEALPLSAVRIKSKIKDCALLVNCTTVGMGSSPSSPLPEEVLHKDLFVYDLVYNPPKTPLLQAAERVGAGTMNGLWMLIYQAMESFHIWTGTRPSPSSVQKALRVCTKS